jgi:cobalamin biosynthesis protein CobD/CbiB
MRREAGRQRKGTSTQQGGRSSRRDDDWLNYSPSRASKLLTQELLALCFKQWF